MQVSVQDTMQDDTDAGFRAYVETHIEDFVVYLAIRLRYDGCGPT